LSQASPTPSKIDGFNLISHEAAFISIGFDCSEWLILTPVYYLACCKGGGSIDIQNKAKVSKKRVKISAGSDNNRVSAAFSPWGLFMFCIFCLIITES